LAGDQAIAKLVQASSNRWGGLRLGLLQLWLWRLLLLLLLLLPGLRRQSLPFSHEFICGVFRQWRGDVLHSDLHGLLRRNL
jgi:hypothetical protein